MPSSDKKLFLLDAMALIYRAFYALNKNPRVNSKGQNTSAILGFANTLYDLLKNERPTHIGVAFDTQAPTVRHADFLEYKANRQAMPDDLAQSIPWIKQLIEAFNIPVMFVDGYEADDVIGTLAKKAEKEGFTVFMMTPDKDFGQLVTENILMYKPGKMGEKPSVLGVNDICEKFGIQRTDQVKDFLGLAGDASDNIPGIPGIGPVATKKLLDEFDNVENIILHAAEIKNERVREKVLAHADQAVFSKQLATIILDVPIAFNERQLEYTQPDATRLKALLETLEFRAFTKRVFADLSLIPATETIKPASTTALSQAADLFSNVQESPELFPGTNPSIANTPHDYRLADTFGKRTELIAFLQQQKMFCFDTETTGTDAHMAELVGMSFAVAPHQAWYVPLPDNYNDCLKIVHEFKTLFENPAIEKTGQNLKFDISMLRWYHVEVKGNFFDTLLAHYLLHPDMRHNMDVLAETYLNYSPVPIENLIGKKGKNQLSMRTIDLETIKEYAAEDADVTLQLRQVFEPLLVETGTLPLFNNIENPLIPVLSSMEAEGVKLDVAFLADYSRQLFSEINTVESEIKQLAGINFNINSPKQLGEVLYEKLQIAGKPRLTKTKQYATGEDVLVKLAHKHPIIDKILDYRELVKLKSTYVDALPTMVNPRTGRIHTSFNQAVTTTGRLSSNNPNLQNIPVRTAKGREIRKAFIPRTGNYILLSADYSQIELRIIASISGDGNMQEDFRRGFDIHSATAARVFGIPIEAVDRDMRRNAKAINFGIVYGISSFGLAEQLGIARSEAADIINQYFIKYPGVKAYMNDTIAFARKHGYVETLMKRRRYLRDINSSNANIRGFAERNAINAPIQGSSADMIKIAMIDIHNEFAKLQFQSRMLLQVHDELVFDVHKNELEKVKLIVVEKMQNAIPLKVPVVVDINTGNNWLDAH